MASRLWGIEKLAGFRAAVMSGPQLASPVCSDVRLRTIMSLRPRPVFYEMTFEQLSDLLYRDLVKIKHANRSRFEKELSDKKAIEDQTKRSDLKDLERGLPPVNAFAELLVEHILAVAWRSW